MNSDDDQRRLVEILVLDILSIKLKYASQNTLCHNPVIVMYDPPHLKNVCNNSKNQTGKNGKNHGIT